VAAQQDPGKRLEQLEAENQRLRGALQEVTILNDLALAIGASLDSEHVMNTIIHRSLRAVGAGQGAITLVGEKTDDPMRTLVRTMVGSSEHRAFHLTDSLLGWMHINKKPLLINDPQHDERFLGVKWDESIRSLLCVPLLVKSELRGVLTVYNKKSAEQFTENDQRLLSIIASQSAQVVENARLYEEEQKLLRIQESLRLASEIQLGLLPKEPPIVPGYDVAGVSLPAQVVGGDYFDFIPMDEDRLAICLGDVSGKGLPAALLMASLQATIRGQTLVSPSPKECLERANKLLLESTDPQKFATFFYAILDTKTHRLTYCNAGHDRPFLVRHDDGPVRLDVGGTVLSFMEHACYEEVVLPFDQDNTLVVFSDGITEATGDDDEQYGEERLAALIMDSIDETASGLIDKIVAAAREHAGDRPQMDDMTLVVIKRDKA
jgi:sigma-B regulation protein RsbU (phosphoserine phosphatase)